MASCARWPARSHRACVTARDGVYGRRKLVFDADTQRRERLLNMSFRLHYPNVADAAHRSQVTPKGHKIRLPNAGFLVLRPNRTLHRLLLARAERDTRGPESGGLSRTSPRGGHTRSRASAGVVRSVARAPAKK